jgi:hypothetical protein
MSLESFERQLRNGEYIQRNIPPVLFEAVCVAADILDVTGDSSSLARELAALELMGVKLGAA